jgi:hypothetical protein
MELDLGANPVGGRLHGPENQTRTFSGYIELISLIEQVRHAREAGPADCNQLSPPRSGE